MFACRQEIAALLRGEIACPFGGNNDEEIFPMDYFQANAQKLFPAIAAAISHRRRSKQSLIENNGCLTARNRNPLTRGNKLE